MSRNEAYITGIGMSQVGQKLTRSPLLLTIDAIKEALDEAGLTIEQIDGVSTWPGYMPLAPGTAPVGAEDIVQALGIKAHWLSGGVEFPSQLGAITTAASAVRAGQARHIICFRTVYEAAANSRPEEYPPPKPGRIDGMMQWLIPYGAFSAANWVGQYAARHMHHYGLTREQLAQIALNGRRNGMLNPRALVREPLTMDQYMESRIISTPLCLFDCDRYTDASTVIIVSSEDGSKDVKCTPIRIAAMSYEIERHTWDQTELMASYPTAKRLWEMTDYKPKDVDVVQLYDGFSFLALTWLEGLGFCKLGEGGEFIEGGHRIALDGELPLNTYGGQISAGRLHGFGFVHESVVQLRGNGGERQVKGNPKVAVATAGGGPLANALLLAND